MLRNIQTEGRCKLNYWLVCPEGCQEKSKREKGLAVHYMTQVSALKSELITDFKQTSTHEPIIKTKRSLYFK